MIMIRIINNHHHNRPSTFKMMRQLQKNTTNNIITWSSNLNKKDHHRSTKTTRFFHQPFFQREAFHKSFSTPPKINMEPKNGGLEDVFPYPRRHFQVPCSFSGVYNPNREIFQELSASRPKDITIRITAASSVWGKCWTFDVWNVPKRDDKKHVKTPFFGEGNIKSPQKFTCTKNHWPLL